MSQYKIKNSYIFSFIRVLLEIFYSDTIVHSLIINFPSKFTLFELAYKWAIMVINTYQSKTNTRNELCNLHNQVWWVHFENSLLSNWRIWLLNRVTALMLPILPHTQPTSKNAFMTWCSSKNVHFKFHSANDYPVS